MEVACPACAEPNPERAKFCLECGSPMASAISRESRRTVTVVFADMVGFTTLGERLDQESLRRVMDRFYAPMRQGVGTQARTPPQFIRGGRPPPGGAPRGRGGDAPRAGTA